MAGQYYSVSTLGGNWTLPYLSEKLRNVAQPILRFRQFCDVREAIGRQRGDTFEFAKAGNVATAGGTLTETSTIPETNFVTNHGTCVINEYGNAVPFTEKLNALGQFLVEPVTEQKLRDDMAKVLDSAAGAQFAATDYVAVCVSTASVNLATNGTASASATADLNSYAVRYLVDYMKKNNVPKYDGRDYVCIASTQALSGLHADSAAGGWQDASKYTESFARNIFDGEVGRFYGCRFVEETGYLSNAIGNGSTHGQAVIFGADNVIEAVAIPEEIRVKQPQDFGRDRGLAWYALLGFKIVWSKSTDSEQHIIFVTSQ